MAYTHGDVVKALARRFRQKVKAPMVFTELALEGSYGNAGRLDVVTVEIASNYGGLLIDGYEVKAQRADFERDVLAEKWRRYLGPLRRFYFATPKGLVGADEIPDPAGLTVWNPDGERWTTLKKPARLEPEVGPDLALRLLYRSYDLALMGNAHKEDWHRRRLEKRERRLDLLEMSDEELLYRLDDRFRDLVRRGLGAERLLSEREEHMAEREEALESIEGIMEAVGFVLRQAQIALGTGQHWGRRRRKEARDALLDLVNSLTTEADAG